MKLVVLTFHGVGPITREIDDGERECWLEKDHFEEVLDLVQDQSHVQLTFDDGNISDYEIVFPSLLRRSRKATFFICSGRIDLTAFLTYSQLHDLQSHGMEIGSHGAAHVPWRGLSPEQLREEVAGSRRRLTEICRVAVDSAACPFGSYDRRVLTGLRSAGYRTVYTSDGGTAAKKHWLRARTTVTRSMPMATIQYLVRHGPGALQQAMIDARKAIKRLR